MRLKPLRTRVEPRTFRKRCSILLGCVKQSEFGEWAIQNVRAMLVFSETVAEQLSGTEPRVPLSTSCIAVVYWMLNTGFSVVKSPAATARQSRPWVNRLPQIGFLLAARLGLMCGQFHYAMQCNTYMPRPGAERRYLPNCLSPEDVRCTDGCRHCLRQGLCSVG
jgi:hypothetical protein